MKYTLSLLTILSLLFIIGCDKDEPIETSGIDYPLTFLFDGVDFNPSTFYRYESNGFSEISVTTGEISMTDMYLETEVFNNPNDPVFNIDLVEIQSDTTSRIRVLNYDVPPTVFIDTVLASSWIQDTLSISLDESDPSYTFDLVRNDNFTELLFCLQTYAYNYYDTFRDRRDVQGFSLEECSGRDAAVFLDNIVEESSSFIAVGDTIVINYSDLVFKK